MAIFDDFHQVPALTGGQTVGAPIIEDKEVRLYEGAEHPWEAAVTVGEFEVGKETGQPLVDARLKIRVRLSRQAR